MKEIVICSAVKLSDQRIIHCHRHSDGILVANQVHKQKVIEQGFVTSTGRYVDRTEAFLIQESAGIPSKSKDGYRGRLLFSEDLY